MAIQLKDRDLWQITAYLPTKTYERLTEWMKSDGSVKSESEAIQRCPRTVLFPEQYSESAQEAHDSRLRGLEAQIAALREAQPPAPEPQKARVRWLSTREAFDALEDAGLSFDRFRRLTTDQLQERFNLVADPARRLHGSNHAKWLHFAV